MLSGDDEVSRLVNRHDWAATPLGPIENWPPTLKAMVGTVLASPVAMAVLWGPDLVQIYNEAFRIIMASGHPSGLGQPARGRQPERWHVDAAIEDALLRGEARTIEGRRFTVERDGEIQDRWTDLTYSPVYDENCIAAGVLVTAVETTAPARGRGQRDERTWRGMFASMREAYFVGEVIRDESGRAHDFRFIEANPAFEAQTGIPVADMLGLPAREVIPGIQDDLIDTYLRVVETGEPAKFEVFVPALGDRWYDAHACRTDDGRFAVLFIEITYRKRVEAALRESEARFRHMADSAPALIWMTDEAGLTSFANMHYDHVFGRPAAKMLGDGWKTIFHPEDLHRVASRFMEAFHARRPFEAEARVIDRRGAILWVHCKGVPRTDDAGRFLGYTGVNLDITERKAAEEALRASEARFRTALEIETVGAIYFDMEGRLIDANDAFCAMGGYSREDVLSGRLTWRKLTPPEWLEPSERAFAELKTRGQTTPYEKEYLRKDGSRWWALFAAKLLPDGTGFEFVVDITERKRAERHGELLLFELNHRVKNTLALVQSIASQTLRSAGSPDQFQPAFEARLIALAHVHDLLSETNWEGAALSEVIAAELTPHIGGDRFRLSVGGPDVQLGSRAALSLAMAFHELATNAAKYGALSVPSGRLGISWDVDVGTDGDRLRLAWIESGGPPVAPPQRRGFGSTLIERGLAHELDGEVELEFEPTGLRCAMSIPLGAV